MYRLFIFFVTELLKDRNFVFGFLASSLFSSLIAQLVKNLPAMQRMVKNHSASLTASSVGKESVCDAEDPGSIPGLG